MHLQGAANEPLSKPDKEYEVLEIVEPYLERNLREEETGRR